MQLVILAAGMGSRFGGLKQLEPMDEHNNFIIDYSVFDAVRAGFGKVVFIIRHDFEEEFKAKVGSSKPVDGEYRVSDEGENGFTAAMGETFLTSVYTPSFTP